MNKTKLLASVSEALNSGSITTRDLQKVIDSHSTKDGARVRDTVARTSAVDIMYYIAGIVLFGAILALIGQAWDSGAATRILLSAGLGTIFWGIAVYLMQSPQQDDVRSGLTNALLLSGSLSVIAGGFIIASEFVSYEDFHFYATAITLIGLSGLHIGFGWYIKRELLALMGVLLGVAAFPMLVFGLFSEAGDIPSYMYWLILAISGGLLAYATRVISWVGVTSEHMARFFDPLSAFGAMGSLYAASHDDSTGFLWLLVLIAGIIGIFYLSIVKQDRIMLGSGSFFLVLTIVTKSFQYFSGYSVATSLFISAVGLIGTAVMATTINRRYMN